MKRVYVNEQWCLGCHLCEYNCAFANSGITDMVKALKGRPLYPRIRVEEHDSITYAVSCRHCTDPLCVKSCISGALHREDGTVCIDQGNASLSDLRTGMSLWGDHAGGKRRGTKMRTVS